ncbi:unnamed protein product [Miscanthus lutarioriparius]|uniref:Uncharacterized protein n=1 Tax=Miscanthus lutarioriparius TaxID=422564 RepID=A0A811MQF0_9POAL|nr:unnamed protein product [Miscanthus lutarioriparius]
MPAAPSSSESVRWPTVGKYKVDVASLESLALPELQVKEETDLFIIDEVGKMELFSSAFFPAVMRVIESNIPVLATIPIPRHGRDIPGALDWTTAAKPPRSGMELEERKNFRNIRCPVHVLESSNIRRAIAPCLLLTVSEPLLFIYEPFQYMHGQDSGWNTRGIGQGKLQSMHGSV